MASISIFTLSENELYNFVSFCDSKFVDANCRKYGFFKIKLDESCAGQCTSLDEFKKQFSAKCPKSVLRFSLTRNPEVKNLYGTSVARASLSERRHYVEALLSDTTNFQVSSNCCMQELENGGEAILQHIFDTVQTVTICNNQKDSVNTVRKRAASLRVAFEKRQLLNNIISLKGRGMAYNAALESEKVTHSSSHLSCHCDSCALTFDNEHIKSHNIGSFYCPNIEEDQHDFVFTTANFAMSHLCYSNMLSNLDSVYSGVSYPALYLGDKHSYFPLHIEDLSLWSFNFLLHGYPKFWMMIPPTSVSRLTDALQKKGNFGHLRCCRNLLHHKYFIPTVQFLKDEDIPYELVIQYEGEGIVLLPNCAHAGWNLGPNLAEACNFGTSNWIPYGCVSLQCNCTPDSVHADLSDLVAVHQPSLLQAYRNGNVYDEVKDPYFQNSILFPKKCHSMEPSIKQERSATCVPVKPESALAAIPSDFPVLGAKKPRVKCPLCHVSWASVQKVNMRSHLRKYHEPLIDREAVRKFTQQYSISFK